MNKHAQNLRAAIALHPQEIAQLFGSGKVEAAADEIDRLERLAEMSGGNASQESDKA